MSMMVRITGAERARIEVAMIVFSNANAPYPIRGVPDNVPAVCYWSGKKGWMDTRVFGKWISEPKILEKLPSGKERVLYVDNGNGHWHTIQQPACLRYSNTTILKFPTNATLLVQSAGSLIISKIKDSWRRRWDQHKCKTIEEKKWKPGDDGSSGKLINLGKKLF